ncbi:hypothetical protein [Aliiroseovarius subalbicans]|uniref:hypothetical protein n=1 Tax=Aliiroseovarius subalbicans TaxID=2925840 RepID=UPI001F57948A|nr:hypothetical protein [Aliiroseovarius subalbicans]MCI2398385.1 hypothetical protein [Aliiroseovarius subalbicans]
MTEQSNGVMISKSGHQAIRLLIASWFIGASTGVVPYEAAHAMAARLIPWSWSELALSTFLFATAWLILIGRQTRGAALLLALFVFWSGYMASFGPHKTLEFHEFWRDLALMGALLLTYTQPAAINTTPEECPQTRLRLVNKPQNRPLPSPASNATGHAAFDDSPDEMAGLFNRMMDYA